MAYEAECRAEDHFSKAAIRAYSIRLVPRGSRPFFDSTLRSW